MNVKNTKKTSKVNRLTSGFILLVGASLIGCGGSGSSNGKPGNVDTTGADTTGVDTTVANGTATLSWIAPSTRADNTALPMSEIGGYKVYMGTSENNLTQYADISDSSQMEFIVNKLSTGTYYFAVTTYNQHGAEGTLSTIVSKTIS
jgi:hypothetical protein